MKKMIWALSIVALLASCNKQTEEQKEEVVEPQTEVVAPQEAAVEAYVSEDGKETFTITERNAAEETICVKKESTGEELKLTRTEAASGEKFQDAEGNYFWFKGEEAYVGKGEDGPMTVLTKKVEQAPVQE